MTLKTRDTKRQIFFWASQFIITLYLFCQPAYAQTITTCFGKIEVTDPLILNLINAPGFQRMKGIDQSGPLPHFIKGFPKFSRYDHSIGVFYLLNKFGAPYDEQVAGLLHDVSHTAFSHVAEHVFKHEDHETSYQDSIHLSAVQKVGLKKVTDRHQFDFTKLDHKGQNYPMLEQPGPDLCADRIEYLLHTGHVLGLLTDSELQNMVSDLVYKDGTWYFNTLHSARKLGLLSLHLTEGWYAAPWNWSMYDWVAKALNRAFEIKLVTKDDFHHKTDRYIMQKLVRSKDAKIRQYLEYAHSNNQTFKVVSDNSHDLVLNPKFRGVNPLYLTNKGLVRVTDADVAFAERFYALKTKLQNGIKIKRLKS